MTKARENVLSDEPGIAAQKSPSGVFDPLSTARRSGRPSQGLRPVDPNNPPSGAPLAASFGIMLSRDLRERLRNAAVAARISDSAFVRRLIVRELDISSAVDERSGRRFVDDDVARACVLMRNVGMLILSARELHQPDGLSGVLGALEGVHARLTRLIDRAER